MDVPINNNDEKKSGFASGLQQVGAGEGNTGNVGSTGNTGTTGTTGGVANIPNFKVSKMDMMHIFDALPLGIRIIIIDTGELVFANRASMDIFGCEDFERDVLGRSAFSFMPEIQPNGRTTVDMANEFMSNPNATMDFQCIKLNGDIFMARISNFGTDFMGKKASIAIIEDITEAKKAEDLICRRSELLDAVKEMETTLLSQKDKTFEDIMSDSLLPIADVTDVDRIDIYRVVEMDGERRFGQKYRWSKTKGKFVAIDERIKILSNRPLFGRWLEKLNNDSSINTHLSIMADDEREFLEPLGVKSLLLTPVLIDDKLWGAIAFQNLDRERYFEDDIVDYLCSVTRLCANAIIKNAIKNDLAETEERMKLMLDSTPLCCQLWDSNFNKIDCNQEAIRFFGFKDKQDFMDRYHDIYPEFQPDGQRSEEKVLLYLNRVVEEGSCVFDWTYKLFDGTLIPTEATLVRISRGDDFLIAGYTRDLSEQNRIMKELYEHEQEIQQAHELIAAQLSKLNLVIRATNIGLWEMPIYYSDYANPDLNNPFIFSDEFRHLLGYTDENDFPGLLGTWISSIHPDDLERVLEHAVNHLLDTSGNTPYNIEYRLKKKDGEYGYYRAYGGTIRDENGTALQITGALMDITESKAFTMMLENILNSIDSMIYITVPETGEVLFMNNKTMSNYGIEGETTGRLCYKLLQKDKDDICEFCPCHQLEKNPGAIISWEDHNTLTNRIHRNTDQYIRWVDGRTVHMQHSVDVTELINSIELAKAANKAKSDFLSMVSHEIRSPMNVILGVAEIELQKNIRDYGIREAFEKIYASGDLLLGIINDILDLAKIEAGKLELVIDKYEMPSLISDSSQLNMMRIGSKAIEFELNVSENMPYYLIGDELRIKQILNNLLSNAFKYTEAGTVVLTVFAEEIEDDDGPNIVFKVSDTGHGMSEEQVSKLFEEYSRFNIRANRTTEGTGLGMSIVKNLVHMMDGDVIIDSVEGEGTTVTVRLPQKRVDSRVIDRELAESLRQFRKSSRAQMKRTQITREPLPYGSVLIVDDVEANLYVARGLLVPYGLKISTATSGSEAIDLIKSGKVFDIVFMDHMMPEMDGIEATKKIREAGYKEPIVALTANAVIGQADVFLSNGFDDFIAKPIDTRQLNNILNRLIRDKQSAEVIEEARKQASTNEAGTNAHDEDGAVDPYVLEAFMRDASKSISVLDAIVNKQGCLDDEEKRLFEIHVHGLKTALANIGNQNLSVAAYKLEVAAQENEIEKRKSEAAAFITSLRNILNELIKMDETKSCDASDEDRPYLCEKLQEIKSACEDYDSETVNDAIKQLRCATWSQSTHELIAAIAKYLLSSDFDEIVETVDEFLDRG